MFTPYTNEIEGFTMNHQILFESDVTISDTLEAHINTVITATLTAQGLTLPCEVSVLITDDATIHEINLEQREIDRPTDVLSFPMFELEAGELPDAEDADPGSGLIPLGDMVISLERTTEQAAEFGHSVEREISYLTVHSVLHLLGYDHMDEGAEKALMRQREEAVLTTLGIVR
ncbi:rRNA maturation RNase YbeY [Bengtsoniella intestinalis]|uniref:rRNA maturation RNase YbeY n=1 Tax=Bengtsoniella intestinalis TaxID=3073143 RepID=UPI00391F90D2